MPPLRFYDFFAGAGLATLGLGDRWECAWANDNDPAVAQQIFPSDDAAGSEDRQGSHGTEASRSSVLDVAQTTGLPASSKIRFARGTARKSPWCAVEYRAY